MTSGKSETTDDKRKFYLQSPVRLISRIERLHGSIAIKYRIAGKKHFDYRDGSTGKGFLKDFSRSVSSKVIKHATTHVLLCARVIEEMIGKNLKNSAPYLSRSYAQLFLTSFERRFRILDGAGLSISSFFMRFVQLIER